MFLSKAYNAGRIFVNLKRLKPREVKLLLKFTKLVKTKSRLAN